MNPDSRPISLINPIPLFTQIASTWPHERAFTASANAVSKPKLLSRYMISLSIVFGIPMTLFLRPLRWISATIAATPFRVPSPPMANRMSTPSSSKTLNIRDHFRLELQRHMAMLQHQSFVAVADSDDFSHVVSVPKLHHDAPDNVVQTGTQTTAAHHRRNCLSWIKIDSLPWTSDLKGQR